ncbi:hypothetical protein [Streptomyces filamentosus]|uniref:hypothetical protein n=1 Tax=Streptomyces filamentosus TaxID=67294 RepID=UPI00147946A5|nr:hypothetical protein [Streptomyces filamentosus]
MKTGGSGTAGEPDPKALIPFGGGIGFGTLMWPARRLLAPPPECCLGGNSFVTS